MKKVAIMTDTVACIPQEKVNEYSIKVIPFHVIMGGKSYVETEINMNQLYAWLGEKENLPTTSVPSVGEFLQAYQELSQGAESILHISMTSAFTMAYGAAIEAKEMAREELPQTTIEVLDSQTVCSSELLIVLEAARAAARGEDLTKVMELANHMILRVNQLSTRDTLFYLDKGGRIFEAKSWAESENSFRAIVEIDASTGGVTRPIAKAETRTQIMEKMVDIAKERVGSKKIHAAIVHANVPDQAEQLKKIFLSQCHCDELYIGDPMAVVAVHNGEGLIEFGFYAD